MKRKCDMCDEDASVHEVVIKNGVKVEKHLCETHAKAEGIAIQSHAPISELITKFVMSQSGQATKSSAKEPTCPECGLTWSDFRVNSLLGCAKCYTSFESQIGPMIERAHEGGTHHIGKAPKRSDGFIDRERHISALRKQLNEAVAAEEYERAASLRDELLHVEKDDDFESVEGASE